MTIYEDKEFWNDEDNIFNLLLDGKIEIYDLMLEDFQDYKLMAFCIQNELLDNSNIHLLKKYSSKLLKNSQFIIDMIDYLPSIYSYASDHIKGDKDITIHALKKDGMLLEFASDELALDQDVVFEAVLNKGFALKFADTSFRYNDLIVRYAIEDDPLVYDLLPPYLHKSFDLALVTLNKHPYQDTWNRLLPDLVNDLSFCQQCVDMKSKLYEFFTEDIKSCFEISKSALKDNAYLLSVSPQIIKANPELCLTALNSRKKIDTSSFSIAIDSSLLKNKEFALKAIEINPVIFKFLHQNLKSDVDVIKHTLTHQQLQTISNAFNVLNHIDDELILNEEVIDLSLSKSYTYFKNLHENTKNKKSFIKKYIKKNYFSLQTMSSWGESCQKDIDLVIAAIKKDGRYNTEFLPSCLKNDLNFWEKFITFFEQNLTLDPNTDSRSFAYSYQRFFHEAAAHPLSDETFMFLFDKVLKYPEYKSSIFSCIDILKQHGQNSSIENVFKNISDTDDIKKLFDNFKFNHYLKNSLSNSTNDKKRIKL